MPTCAIETCPNSPLSRGLCTRHHKAAQAAGTLPQLPKAKTTPKPHQKLRLVKTTKPYETPSDRDRQRVRVRRAIEEKLEDLAMARAFADGDW